MALLRREFVLDKPVVRARLYATAHGVYEAELERRRRRRPRAGPGLDQLRAPAALPDLRRHRPARRGPERDRRHPRRRLVPRLPRLRRQAGTSTATAPAPSCSWRSSTPTAAAHGRSRPTARGGRPSGPVTRAGIYKGETVDFRRELPGWSTRRLRRRGLDAGRGRLARRRARSSPRPARRCAAPRRCPVAGDHARRRRAGRWSTSARTWSAGSGFALPDGAGRHRDHRPARRGARARRARAPGRCARRRDRRRSSSTGTGRGRGSRGSPSTASATPR